ncbi:hypothetical protein HanRHA438_Chr15g0701151 [Helianthus annuus]|uniref:Uncharacterized protein n=1 Tax=Helianthus annuus TaxID=4232 RepID=A0A251S7Z0_HELAN|nr:hypothetical protein HanXRQr2_Chr15g0688801 [Helianthus annuus]KAJ0450872.1 hypothetical protein HanHA300_Chr15g0561151 [Helianthus annuus]KAJ0455204.1 hypothetical protein HanIR_Chr15g0748541 [Helianthus annuus]KAJ0472733.1 hypothetical protein HanHA89_Chr15g0610371 [Helianthus annuus]KAJ0648339.1 hypothetical protein HanLR1_Chr15g0571771 [Helianthus annuus]
MSSDLSSSSSDGVLDDMIIAVTQETLNYLREEAQSSTSHTRQSPLERDRLGAHECLMQDYFCENLLYNDEQFRRMFRMSRRLFLKISNDLAGEFPFSHKEKVLVAKLVYLEYKSVLPQLGN